MSKPTHQDATLLVQLARWRTDCNLAGAMRWLWSDQFTPDAPDIAQSYPRGGDEDRKAALICEYFETIGTLHEHNLLDGELLFDWLDVAPVWDRLKGYVCAQRKAANGEPLWPHFEALATAHKRQTRQYST